MALQIFIAHTGQRFQAQPGSFASLETFREWVAKHGSVAEQNQISLTAQGKALRLQSLNTPQEIFVYDRQNIAASSSKAAKSIASQVSVPSRYEPRDPPDTIADQNNLQAWQELFMARRTWALSLVDDCSKLCSMAQQRYSEIDVIQRSIWAAIENLQTHVTALDQRFAQVQGWAKDLTQNYHDVTATWESTLATLKNISASAAMIRFMAGREPRTAGMACLEDLIEPDDVRKAGARGGRALTSANKSVSNVGHIVDRLIAGTDDVLERAENGLARSASMKSSEPAQLKEDIEAIARKVGNDYETTLAYPESPKSVSQASKSALLHTKNFLPNLSKRSIEMYDLLADATRIRNTAAVETVEIMQAIGVLNTMCTEIVSRLDVIDVAEEDHHALEVLQTAHRTPIMYALFLAEAIRRREWNDKIKADLSTLANEMASFRDEEERRRKKWGKTVGVSFLPDKFDGRTLGLEVNLHGVDEQWPLVTRQDLDLLLETLQKNESKPEIITSVAQAVADLDKPTRQQTKRANAFKAGSLHEAALGQSALLVRGDNDLLRTLQDEKSKAENKLRGAESRIRRLEDLLHRQSHMSGGSTRTLFQPNGSELHDVSVPPISPRIDTLSRRSSTASRRFSANLGPEEQAYAQRLIKLETELITAKERTAGLEREVTDRTKTTTNFEGLIEEANSTKKDLLRNLEAQKREFAVERRSLEAEIKELKGKIEAYEEDMDHIIGSRENEKASVDERVRALQQELETLKAETAAESQKTQGQVDYLRNDAKLRREENESLSRELNTAKENLKHLKSQLDTADAAHAGDVDTLAALHRLVVLERHDSQSPAELTIQLLSRAREMMADAASHHRDLGIAHRDRGEAIEQLDATREELSNAQVQLRDQERDLHDVHQELAAEKAKLFAIDEELHNARLETADLRTKLTAGESGSEALRKRVVEEELKTTRLSGELAGKRSQVGSLEEELRAVQERQRSTQQKLDNLGSRFEARSMRAKDLTQRLYAQNDRLCRLLERMSYSVSREGDSMIIKKLPRAERISAADSSDPSSSMQQSVVTTAARRSMIDSSDLELLYWMQNEDVEVESERHEAYLKAIGNFDVEAFCETMLKRVKDAEYTARKYTKDARAYREKYQRAQKEAHEKIAFKHFKDGDLALFLPTRNQATGAWAAFNVGAPHYFLHEQDSHKLRARDWLLARIHKIDERVVDLSRSLTTQNFMAGDRDSIGGASNGADSFEDDNPFDLSDGLRWYLIEASEEKPGAPTTPGLGRSTVATTSVDATGSIRRTKKTSTSGVEGVSKTLSRSLDSRRSSTNSKKAVPFVSAPSKGPGSASDIPTTSSLLPPAEASAIDPARPSSSSRPEVPSRTSTPQPPTQLPADDTNTSTTSKIEAAATGATPTVDARKAMSTGTSPSKKSVIWDSLWTLDMSVERGKSGQS